MKTPNKLIALVALACASMGSASAADAEFINPDWANSAWYLGAGVGQSRAKIDDERIIRSLTANGATMSSFTSDERDTGYKLFVGKKLNRYLAVEAGYFDLGKFDFAATTSGNGSFNGEAGFRGVNIDVVGELPLSQRLSLLARVGAQYGRSTAEFSGNRLNGVTAPRPGNAEKLNAKAGLGLEYKLNESWALRGEVERYRMLDPVGNRGDIDMGSISLVYKMGRPAAVAPVRYEAPPVVAQQAAPVVQAVEPAPRQPEPVSEKVSFAAEALFDFDRAVVKPEGKAALDDLLAKLEGMNTEVMIAVGHTDSKGSNAYNDKLSLRRANAVKAYLVSKGLDPARMYTEGKGEVQPIADNASDEGRAQNRRVTIEVVGTRVIAR
jgi:OOP family OmpA-OmpF porin